MERKILAAALVLSILLDTALLVGNIIAKNWPMSLGNLLIDGMFVYVLYIGYKSASKRKQ
jgi:hypothetical protein